MNKLIHTLFLSALMAFFSCKTDIDVNAEFKDIPVVYGIINPSDTNHYIKVNKVFLGETSALDLAADASNYDYADGDLALRIDEYNESGNVVKSYSTGAGNIIRTINEIPKDPGLFDNSTNVLYKFIEPSINRNSTYKLKIVNELLGKEITAETEIVGNSSFSLPNINSRVQFWIGTVATGKFGKSTIRVTAGSDAGRVQPFFVFNYREYTITGDSTLKSVVMPLAVVETTTSSGTIEWELKGETFFDNIKAAVASPSSSINFRQIENFSLELAVAGTELSTFIEVSAPSTSVNQNRPSYTNIANGIGIFSSRERSLSVSSINPWSSQIINLHNNTIAYLESLNLGFCFGRTSWVNPISPCVP